MSKSSKSFKLTQSGPYIAFNVFWVLFVVFTILLKFCDVASIGANGTKVGFSTINLAFNRAFNSNQSMYLVTELLGYLCLVIAMVNAIFALISLIRTKSLVRMNRLLLLTMILYAAVVFFYVLFEFLVINFRPTDPEPSYPSSHTMLALCILYSQSLLLKFLPYKSLLGRAGQVDDGYYESKGVLSNVLRWACYFAMVVMVLFRAMCGVHFLTDIIGAVLLSVSLCCLYTALFEDYLWKFTVLDR